MNITEERAVINILSKWYNAEYVNPTEMSVYRNGEFARYVVLYKCLGIIIIVYLSVKVTFELYYDLRWHW